MPLNDDSRENDILFLEWHRFCITGVSWIEVSGLWEHPSLIQDWVGLDFHLALECWASKNGWGVLP